MNITKIQDAVDRALMEADITDCKPVDIELVAKKIGFVIKRIQFRSISSKIQGLMLLDGMPSDMQKKLGSSKLFCSIVSMILNVKDLWLHMNWGIIICIEMNVRIRKILYLHRLKTMKSVLKLKHVALLL